MEERAQPGPAIVPWPGPSEWGFVSSPAATVRAPSLDSGSHVPLAVLTGRLCAAVGMCRVVCVCVCVWTERSGGESFVSQHTETHHKYVDFTRHFKAVRPVAMELRGQHAVVTSSVLLKIYLFKNPTFFKGINITCCFSCQSLDSFVGEYTFYLTAVNICYSCFYVWLWWSS